MDISLGRPTVSLISSQALHYLTYERELRLYDFAEKDDIDEKAENYWSSRCFLYHFSADKREYFSAELTRWLLWYTQPH